MFPRPRRRAPSRPALAWAALAALCLLGGSSAQSQPNYRILISNDDGVRAPALAALAQALKSIGDVVIVAPLDNQSGVSQGLTSALPISRDDVMLPGGLTAIALAASPATTMQIAIKNIVMPRPNLVVTGINAGLNLGTSTYLSGTIGGARQAVMEGVPAIATAMPGDAVARDAASAAQQVVGIVRQVRQRGLPAQTFLNVNIPPMPAGGYKGYQITTQAAVRAGVETFEETRRPGTNRTLYWSVYREGASAPEGSDIWAVNNGYVSITPMHVGEYDEKLAPTLRNWFRP